jgi:hypothetical protein
MGDNDEGVTEGVVVEFGRPGNMANLRHGANSDRLVSTIAAELATELIGQYPWFLDTDIVGIEQYCRAEARTRLLNEYAMGIAENDGIERVPAYIWQQITAAENNAMRAAEALGLTPLGRLKIAKDAGFAKHFANEGVSNLRDRGRALRSGAE